MVDLNTVERELRAFMKKFSLEEISAGERFFDPELHEVASYEDAKGMTKGIILNTVRKGFRYKGKIIKRPKVLVTK
ncbi:MAG: nucleotide exchange factor GrpE, partial [Nanoarchaeota archaeon]|nr:nucleotide exchange factor GrpE [Nanoarchaeota archaeon]